MKENDNSSFYELFSNEEKELVILLNKYKMIYRETINIDPSITFGTEIEYRYANYEKVSAIIERVFGKSFPRYSNWENTYDMTVCSKYKSLMGETVFGGEVISPILNDTKKNWHNLEKVLNIIISLDGIVDERCGSHIHIGGHVLENNKDYLINFLLLWSRFEHIIYRYGYGFNNYMYEKIMPHTAISDFIFADYQSILCSSFEQILEKVVSFKVFSSPVNFLGMYQYNNLNVKSKNTIEFRIPNGTLNKCIWQNNINFFTHLLESAKTLDKEYLNLMLYNKPFCSVNDYKKLWLGDALLLSDLIFSNNRDKLLFLKQYLKVFQIKEKEYKEIRSLVK